MDKTLFKTKIVLEDDGKSLVTYFWKRTFLCFGYWYPFGCSSSNSKVSQEKLNRINDNEVSKVLFNKFLKGFK